jgi:hypothetical protein
MVDPAQQHQSVRRRRGHRRSGAALFCALLIGAGAPGGCRSEPRAVPYAREYPGSAVQKETVDIQVFRRTKTIELTNTTARAYGPMTMWLNMRYSCPIEKLAIGETLTLPLRDFRDVHSEPFRGGGFFASEPPDRLVLAQFETEGGMLGLIVVGGQAE